MSSKISIKDDVDGTKGKKTKKKNVASSSSTMSNNEKLILNFSKIFIRSPSTTTPPTTPPITKTTSNKKETNDKPITPSLLGPEPTLAIKSSDKLEAQLEVAGPVEQEKEEKEKGESEKTESQTPALIPASTSTPTPGSKAITSPLKIESNVEKNNSNNSTNSASASTSSSSFACMPQSVASSSSSPPMSPSIKHQLATSYGFNEDQIGIFEETFQIFDKDSDGFISLVEIRTVMNSLGFFPCDENIKQSIQNVDNDNSGTVDFEEFINMMSKFRKVKTTGELDDELKDVFDIFDKNKDGFIDQCELKDILTRLGETVTDSEVFDMIREADTTGNSKVSFAEFRSILYDNKAR